MSLKSNLYFVGGYNAPLPPTPERPEFITGGDNDLPEDSSYIEADSVDGYLVMGDAANSSKFYFTFDTGYKSVHEL